MSCIIKTYLVTLCCIILGLQARTQVTGIKAIGDPCSDFTIALQITGTTSTQFVSWNFGDPASGANNTVTITGSSGISNPVHTFTAIGTYNVCATYQEPGQPEQTVCRDISIGLCCNGIISINDSCAGKSIGLNLNTVANISSISWNFGDAASGPNNTSTSLAPTHVFTAPGSYTVTAVVIADCGNFTASKTINIVSCTPPPPCTGSVNAVDSCLANGTRFSTISTSAISAISWNFGDAASGPNNTSASLTPTHIFSAAGSYTVTAVVTAACGSFTVTRSVAIIDCTPPPPCTGSINAVDSCLATGTRFSASSASSISAISWNFGDAASGSNNTSASLTPTHIFSAAGSYTVTAVVTAACGSFTVTQTVAVVDCTPPPCTATISSTGSCIATPVVFSLNASAAVNSVQWNFGDPLSGANNQSASSAPGHLFFAPGTYTVTAIANLACGIDTTTQTVTVLNCDTITVCTLQIANAFSPNGDGINDLFNPRTNCNFTRYELHIFNRWGQQVYHSRSDGQKWNGRFKGRDCPVGAYVYLLTYQFTGQPQKTTSGSVMLLR